MSKIEELKLLKDYVYGVDHKGKDIHMHKFNKACFKSSHN
jgi:hypothetical protein